MKEMKLMDLAKLVWEMGINEEIEFNSGGMDDIDMTLWFGVRRVNFFDNDNPMFIVSLYGGEANAYLYHINEFDHRIGNFCEKELDKWWERTEQNWINCCARMLADYMNNWGNGVSDVITVETEDE